MRRCHNAILGILFLLTLLVSSIVGQGTTKEEIVASRKAKKIQLEGILDSIQKKLASHSSGLTILEDQQLKHLQEKSRIFQHQIEEFHRELDEEEIQARIDKAHLIKKSRIKQEL